MSGEEHRRAAREQWHRQQARDLRGEARPPWEKAQPVPWPLRALFDLLETGLEFISALGFKPDWYADEYQRKTGRRGRWNT